MTEWTREELQRYARQIILPGMGEEGQARLKGGSVALVGAGGLGSPAALYLAAAGVGRIGLIEFDTVDASNLHRQVLYGTADVGRPKTEAAQERLRSANPHIEITVHPERLAAANALEILRPYDVVADGSDNFATRYLVNDACVLLRKPNVYGSVFRFEGQASVFDARVGPCYRCLFPVPPPPDSIPSCAEGGVLGVLPGLIGLIQATEVLKILLETGETLIGRLVLYDALQMSFRELRLAKSPDCPACGKNPVLVALEDEAISCETGSGGTSASARSEAAAGGSSAGSPARPGRPETAGKSAEPAPLPPPDPSSVEISVRQLQARLESGEATLLLDVREPFEAAICALEGSRLVPMGQIQSRVGELDPNAFTVVYCHAGVRSYNVARFLRDRGFPRTWSLHGGIDTWAAEIDRSMPRY